MSDQKDSGKKDSGAGVGLGVDNNQGVGDDRNGQPRAKASDTISGTSGKPTAPASAAGKNAKPAAGRRPAAGAAAGGGQGGKTTGSGGAGGARKGPGVLSVLALLLALVALVVAAWLWYRGEQRLAGFDERLGTVEVGMESSVQDVVLPRLAQLQDRIERQAEAGEAQQQALASLQETLESSQLQLSGLSQRLDGGQRQWQLLQIETLLLTANRRLQLYNDPRAARTALELANEAIADLGDPRLFDVRSRIANEIAALTALPDPDIEGLALSLTALAQQIPELPLASDVPAEYQTQEEGGAQASPTIDFSSGWRHFVDSVGDALQGMVTIRRADGTQSALLPPDQVFFLNQNLLLKLQSARLALLNRNTELYRASLTSAVEWLQRYYATDSAAVTGVIDRLNQMQNVKLDWQVPDIAGSLAALRAYMRAWDDAGQQGQRPESDQQQGQRPESDEQQGAEQQAAEQQDDEQQSEAGGADQQPATPDQSQNPARGAEPDAAESGAASAQDNE